MTWRVREAVTFAALLGIVALLLIAAGAAQEIYDAGIAETARDLTVGESQ